MDGRRLTVADAVGSALAQVGVADVFGLLGSGNLTVTNALRDGGARFHSARQETGAVCMADGYARVTGRVGVVSVHQGPGLTNAITGLTEAAKTRTPLLVLAADTPSAALRSNFRIDQAALVTAVGAVAERMHSPETAVADALRAYWRAVRERRAVVLMMPLDVQAAPAPDGPAPPAEPAVAPARPADDAVARVADALAGAQRPLIVAGRGASRAGAGPALRELGELTGALLATSAPANGLFAGDPYALGISGGFASPVANELIGESDVVIAFGATLNAWTTRYGALIGEGTRVVQVDAEPAVIGAHRRVDDGLVGDARATAEALVAALQARDAGGTRGEGARTGATARDGGGGGRRTPEVRDRIAAGAWRGVPFEASGAPGVVDPRAVSIALDERLPDERTVVIDSGAFMGWPAMYLRVPDEHGFVFPQSFQCVGLALGHALGAAAARPDRLTVAAVGDGGFLMSLPELETLGRLAPNLVVVIYDDRAYGAEVHHFRPMGQAVDLAQFPDADLAALARAAGCDGLTVRSLDDLSGLDAWLAERSRPLVLDVKVDPDVYGEWLAEAFRQ